MSQNPPYHQLVVVLGLIEQDNKILILRRNNPEHEQWHHRWGFPGGKIDLYETPSDALKREIKEETGLTINSERLLGVYTQHWTLSKGIQQTFLLLYQCNAIIHEIQLREEENDAYSWETIEDILLRPDLLDGGAKMLQELYLNKSLMAGSIN